MSEKWGADTSVSLIVVNYNAGSVLADCVGSAVEQAKELIIVDNASSDDSVSQLTARFSDEPYLRVIQNEQNLGFAAACNIGANAATSPYLLFLNPDCILAPDVVSLLLEVLEANSDTGMVGGLLLNPDGTEQRGGRRAIPTPWRSFVRAFGLTHFADRWPKIFFDFHLQRQPLPDHPIEVEAISGACMMVRREALDDVGLLDNGYFMHCEDLDWCMRFRQKGWKILFVPGAKLIHHQGACSKARPVFVEWHKHKGMMRFYKKFFRRQYPGVLMWLVWLGVWLRFAVVASMSIAQHVAGKMGLRRD